VYPVGDEEVIKVMLPDSTVDMRLKTGALANDDLNLQIAGDWLAAEEE